MVDDRIKKVDERSTGKELKNELLEYVSKKNNKTKNS